MPQEQPGKAGATLLVFACNEAAVPTNVTRYLGPGSKQSSEARCVIQMPFDGTLDQLRCNSDLAPGAGDTFVYTIRVNGGDSAVTCTTNNPNTSSSDLTNSVVVSAGDLVCVKVVVSATGAACFHLATIRYI